MFEIKILDHTTKKTFNENYDSYYLFRKRYVKLRYSKKLQIMAHSTIID